MNLSVIDKSLLLAAFFRGNTSDQRAWTSSSDQVVTLSLFYTGDITADECRSRFSNRGYVGGLYGVDGQLHPQIETRYQNLIDLLREQPQLVEGGGDFATPAYPTYTACRLTDICIRLIPEIIESFPRKPEFPNWPDRRLAHLFSQLGPTWPTPRGRGCSLVRIECVSSPTSSSLVTMLYA